MRLCSAAAKSRNSTYTRLRLLRLPAISGMVGRQRFAANVQGFPVTLRGSGVLLRKSLCTLPSSGEALRDIGMVGEAAICGE